MSREHDSQLDDKGRWMGTPAVAEYLGVNQRTVYRLIDEGQLPAYKFGRVIRLREQDVAEFVERSRIAPGTLANLYPERAP